MATDFQQLLDQMQLGEADFVRRFRELSKLTEEVRVDDGALPVNAWLPTRHTGSAAIANPFDRSIFGWEATTVAGAVGAELVLSLDGVLPRGYALERLRVEYAANQSIGTGVLLELVRFNRAAGTIERGQSVIVAASAAAAFTHQTVSLVPAAPIRAVDGQEQLLVVRISASSVGGVLRVKSPRASYSYVRAAA